MDFTVDGIRIHAATGSRELDPTEPAVILVHGSGMDRTVWQMQTRYLAHKGRRVLAVDLPGHGRSEGDALGDMAAMADWLARFMDAASVETACVAGHSMGSLIAIEATARHPDRVRALGLVGTAAVMPVHPDLIAAAEAGGVLAPNLITDWGFGPDAHMGGHPSPGLWVSRAGFRVLANGRHGSLAAGLKACNAYTGAVEAAARITCPTRLILGAEDRMTPVKAAQPLIEAMPHAEVIVLPDTGHMLPTEAPIAVAKALLPLI